MLATALRRRSRQADLYSFIHRLASCSPQSGAPEDAPGPSATKNRKHPPAGPLLVPRDTECLIQQRIGLKNISARVHRGHLSWESGSQREAQDTAAEARSANTLSLAYIRHRIAREVLCASFCSVYSMLLCSHRAQRGTAHHPRWSATPRTGPPLSLIHI